MSTRDFAESLSHDVGKYVARIAKNVPVGGDVPKALVPLLRKDLYSLPGGQRPSECFESRISAVDKDVRLEAAKGFFRRLDALENKVDAGDAQSLREACQLAVSIENLLQQYAQEKRQA